MGNQWSQGSQALPSAAPFTVFSLEALLIKTQAGCEKQPAVSPQGPGSSSYNFSSIRQRRTLFGARCGAGMSVARWRDAGCSGQGASHSVPVLATTVTCAGSKQPEERLDTEFQTVFFFFSQSWLASNERAPSACSLGAATERICPTCLPPAPNQALRDRDPPTGFCPRNKSWSKQEIPRLWFPCRSSVAVNQIFQSGVRRWPGDVCHLHSSAHRVMQGGGD